MDQLRDLLQRTLRKHGLQSQAEAALVCHRAQQWLSQNLPLLRDAVVFTSFQNGVLSAACRSSVAAQELRQREETLLIYLRSAGGGSPQSLRIGRSG